MSPWSNRPLEERSLLNPAFCSCLLWQAATGYASMETAPALLPFDVAFLILPIVLHVKTRESLPRSITTSLAVWLTDHPLARADITERARVLVPYTKEALLFGGLHGLFRLENSALTPLNDLGLRIINNNDASEEVQQCMKRAMFVGRWLARAGSPDTIMALIGVKP